MKKIIKLTESDLSRIVKRVIKENDSMKEKIKSRTINNGLVLASKLVGNTKTLLKVLNPETPMEFLNYLNNLKPIRNKYNDEVINFIDPSNNVILRYSDPSFSLIKAINTGVVDDDSYKKTIMVSHEYIWDILREFFNLSWGETQNVLTEWLYKSYKLKPDTIIPTIPSFN
jgi:hypothetical protein